MKIEQYDLKALGTHIQLFKKRMLHDTAHPSYLSHFTEVYILYRDVGIRNRVTNVAIYHANILSVERRHFFGILF